MATLEQFRRQVGGKIGLDYSSSGLEQTLIDEWLNEGVREVLLRTHCYVASSTMNTTAGVWRYTMAQSILEIRKLWRDGSTNRMIRVTPEDIFELQRNTDVQTDDSSIRWALQGSNMLLIWPTPASATTISILYVPKPSEMSFTTHDPSTDTYGGIPVEFHPAIRLWALAEAADYDDDESSEKGETYRRRFEEYLRVSLRRRVNGKGGALAPARLARSKYDLVPHDNSADW